MANQRDKKKRQVSGYIDSAIKEALIGTGMDESSFIEMALVQELIRRKRLDSKRLKELVENHRLRAATIMYLQREGIIPE